MVEGNAERRLAAIVAIDVAGYSRLMGADEDGTLAAMKGHREATAPIGEKHGGRMVGTAGDGELWEFPSVTEAIAAAIEFQVLLAERNTDIPDDRKMLYRIGINSGDVMVDGDEIYGDGVNVAARLEALAPPGGICVSRTVRNQVRDRLEIAFEDMGEIEVKNIARPVRVFRVLKEGEVAKAPRRSILAKPWSGVAAAIVMLLVIAGGGLWWWQSQPDFKPVDPAKMADKLSSKPSIAVLPFANISGDKEQEYFADGMTDDLITDLSKLSGLIVIARNSVFTYKGKNVKVQDVARDLNVTHVLEGSIRRAGNNIRINAQLINAKTGEHLWAERFDGIIEDVFKLQDQVTAKIVAAMKVKLTGKEQQNLKTAIKINPKAYELYQQGVKLFRTNKRGDDAKQLKLYEHAVKLEPNFADAHARLAEILYGLVSTNKYRILPAKKALALAKAHAAKALALDPDNSIAFTVLAWQAMHASQPDKAIALAEKAVRAAPNDVDAVTWQAMLLAINGQDDVAAATAGLALQLEPNPSPRTAYRLALTYFHARKYKKAIALAEQALAKGMRKHWPLGVLIPSHAYLGQKEKMARAKAAYIKFWPALNWRIFKNRTEFFRPRSTQEHWLQGLRLAGIPEWPYGVKAKKENLLTRQEAEAIFSADVQHIGASKSGWRFRHTYSNNGDYHGTRRNPKGRQFTFTSKHTRYVMAADGKHVLEKCTRDPKKLILGWETCSLIFRNPAGSKATRDDYISSSARSSRKFSVFPINEKIDWTKAPK